MKIRRLLKKINPCDESYSEDSFMWKLLCFLFPDCWCCAGVRGVVYGVFISVIFFTLLELV